MKGKYSGRYMTIYGHVLPGAASLTNWAGRTNITERAKQRLRVVDWLKSHGNSVSLTARHYGLNRETVREWRNKFNQIGMAGLNDKSHRPKNLRRPTTSWQTVDEIVKTRRQYPAWSKYKIAAVLKRDKNIIVSASTAARVFKRKGLILKKISAKRTRAAKHPKKRFPRGLRIHQAGDMVQMNTKHVCLIGGKKIYQFTAIDVLTKRRVLRYYSSLSSKNGADFLKHCLLKFPFAVRNIQTDNGPEFLKYFDKSCLEKRLPHYFIETRTPKQNTYVENSHGSDDREFYGQGNIGSSMESMQVKLEEWEYVWNCVRPHEALGYLTPEEYLSGLRLVNLSTKDVIVLQT